MAHILHQITEIDKVKNKSYPRSGILVISMYNVEIQNKSLQFRKRPFKGISSKNGICVQISKWQ